MVTCLVSLLLLAVQARAWSDAGMRGVIQLEDGNRVQVEEFEGASKLAALQHLWETAEVVVQCPKEGFAVYTGSSMDDVRGAYARKQAAWCGLSHALGNGGPCRAAISPFGTTYVAVAKPKKWLEGLGAGGTDSSGGGAAGCTLARVTAFSMPRFLLSVVGTFLFWSAPELSTSTPFRLTGGTLGFMALSAVLVLFILYRQMPHKRTLAVGSAVFGTGFLAAIRYVFGTWLPTWGQVVRSPVVLGYLVLSGLVGLALTYWYNNPNNAKVNTMLNVALHLVGLSMAAAGPSLPEVSALWVASLLGARALSLLSRYRSVGGVFRQAKRAAQEMAAVDGAAAHPAGAVAAPPAAPAALQLGKPSAKQRRMWGFAGDGVGARVQEEEEGGGGYTPVLTTARGGPAGAYVAALEGTPAVAAPREPEISPLVQRGLVLNEETGHLIHIGKATYNRLLGSGYVVDRSKGVITPPPPAPSSPAGPLASPTGSGRAGARRRRPSSG